MMRMLLTFFVVGLVTIVVVSIGLMVLSAVLGIAGGLVSVLLFKVAPILLVGWLALTVWNRIKRRKGLSSADRRWLDGD